MEAWTMEQMMGGGYDCSHDFGHLQRVRRMAKILCEREQIAGALAIDTMVVDMACLVHDLIDAKYCNK